MRRYCVALVTFLVLGCGASKPPQAPLAPGGEAGSAPSGSIGVAAVAPELESNADAVLTADLAGMRANPILSHLAAQGRGRDPVVAAMMDKIDQIDLRATIPSEGEPEIVAVMWGKLPNDPREEHGLQVTFDDGKPLASGVKEYVARGGDLPAHVFVVKDGVWVVTTGSKTARVRERYASALATSSSPATPSGDLFRLRANHAVLARAPQEAIGMLGDVDKVDISLGSGASSLRAVVSFKEPKAAKDAATQIRAVTGLLAVAMLANKECKALDKISIDVKNEAKDVSVEVKGIADALSSWDSEACSAKPTHRDHAPPEDGPPRPRPGRPTPKKAPSKNPKML